MTEPAFCHEGGTGPFLAATVCLWRLLDDPLWRTGDIDFPRPANAQDPDGSTWLFDLLAQRTPEAYCTYANDYFEIALNPVDVRQIFEHRPLNTELVQRINPDIDLADLTEALDVIGYPAKRASV
jgi:hypothetical protein